MDNFNIKNIDELEATSNALRNYLNVLSDNNLSLEMLKKLITENWQNAEGLDIADIEQKLTECNNDIDTKIINPINAFISTIDNLAYETRRNQNNSL